MLRKFKVEPVISVSYLQGLARVRFAIWEIAALLHSHFGQEGKTELLYVQLSDNENKLMQLAKKVCTDPSINSTNFRSKNADMSGPAIYLLKLLVRQYGFSLLKQASEKFVWIIPEGLRTADLVSQG